MGVQDAAFAPVRGPMSVGHRPAGYPSEWVWESSGWIANRFFFLPFSEFSDACLICDLTSKEVANDAK